MSDFLHALLPNSDWVLAARDGEAKDINTFSMRERDSAEAFISAYPGREILVLAGRPRTDICSPPSIEHVASICAVGIRVELSQKSAIKSLASPPGISFEDRGLFHGKRQRHFVAAWRFEKPIPPREADRIEALIAERLNGERLKFFLPVPRDDQRQDFMPRFIEPRNVEAALAARASDDDDGLTADCAPERRAYVIEPIAQRGAITLLSGEAGLGKSQIVLDMGMRVTRGIGLPGQDAPSIGGVLCCEEEDDWKADVIPRLIANEANRKLVKGIRAQDLHTEKGIARLDALKTRFEEEIGLPVLLLILSPYMACFGGGSNQEVHMREKLQHIAAWAKRSGCAIIGVAHLDGSGGVAGPKTHRRLARASWKVIEDEETGQRFFICDKANNTPDDFKLAYRIQGVTIQGGIRTSKIVWEEVDAIPIRAAAPAIAAPAMNRIAPPRLKLTAKALEYAAALQQFITPGGPPINQAEVKRAMAKREMTNRDAYYQAIEALQIRLEGNGNRAEAKLLIPPSQWPAGLDLTLG